MRRSSALYPLTPRLQRQGLADLLRLHEHLVAEISQLIGDRVLVERAETDQLLAAIVHEIAERGNAAAIAALEIPGRPPLAIEGHRKQLLITEPLHVLVAIRGRLCVVVAV